MTFREVRHALDFITTEAQARGEAVAALDEDEQMERSKQALR
jgi:hypothetical protein